MNTTSMWEVITPDYPRFPKLEQDTEADVVIVGAGITGITAAMLLTEAGKKVLVLDQGSVGKGTTGYSTGNMYVHVQPYYNTIKKKFDTDTVKAVAFARRDAIDFVEGVVRQNNIDCHFVRRPYYIYTSDEKNIDKLDEEYKLVSEAGIDIKYVNEIPAPVPFAKAICYENQARLNPLKYVVALAKNIASKGCRIYENTQVLDYEEKDDYCIVKTVNHNIKTSQVIVATHIPKGFNMVQTLAAPYRSYVVAVTLKGSYPDAEFADMSKTGHVFSTHGINRNEPEILCLAGNHHKTGQGDEIDHYKHHLEYLHKHFEVEDVKFKWSGQHYHSGDGLPYIGPSTRPSKRIFMATSFYADGLTYGTVAARILAERILGRESKLSEVFNSTRFTPLKSAGHFIKENVNVAAQYLKDLPPLKEEEDAVKQIVNGDAKVIQHEGEKLAVHRDEHGKLHVVSAVCTHMECIVNWNPAEKSWDCPCHGSRFKPDGKLIEGPAFYDLPCGNVNS